MVWYGMVWYGMVWYGMVWYGMVWYGMAWHGMALYKHDIDKQELYYTIFPYAICITLLLWTLSKYLKACILFLLCQTITY